MRRILTLLAAPALLCSCETMQELYAPENKQVVTETVQLVDGKPVITRTTAAPIDAADAAHAQGTVLLFTP
jgi:hypothetical protein